MPRAALGALGAIALVASAIGIIVAAGLPGSSRGASTAAKSSGSTSVQRRDLVATDTQAGTLSYANPQTVFNRLSGTITELPAVGAVIRAGQTLYRVDGSPVVLFNGTVPAYRDLSQSVSDGVDIQELKRNLVALGFDPDHQITINQTFDAATTTAVDRWQASVGETQTGTVTLGQIVFLPGAQKVTAVDAVLGGTGAGAGASGGSSSASGSTGSGSSSSAASTVPIVPQTQFVSLMKTGPPACGAPKTSPAKASTPPTPPATGCNQKTNPTKPSGAPKTRRQKSTTLAALLALLKAETLQLQRSQPASGSGGTTGAGSGSAATTPARGGGGGGAGASSSSAAAGGSGAGSASGASGAGSASGAGGSGSGAGGSGSGASGSSTPSNAQAILQTTSSQLVVTVNLDATKQSEAVVNEPVTVQLPDGETVSGKITQVSPVAQTASSSSSSSSSAAAGGAASGTPSATVPVTIVLTGKRPAGGLDQAAVSVNFQQQVEKNVLSVPVSALLATAGGGYAVQESAAPHSLIAVTPGLFAAGYVQISGAQIYPGLQVTDSQG